jgi:hypothetical protein
MDIFREDRDVRSGSLRLEKINRDTWSRFRDLFSAKAGILNCRIPLRIARNVVNQLTYPDCGDVAAALAKYDIGNQKNS